MTQYAEVDAALAPYGKLAMKALEKEAELLSKELDEKEALITLCASAKMTDDLKLLALTDTRFIYVINSGLKKSKIINYSSSKDAFSGIRKDMKKIMFEFNGDADGVTLSFPNNRLNFRSIQTIAQKTGVDIEEIQLQFSPSKTATGKVSKKVSLEFVNGHKEVGLKSRGAKLIQLENGYVYFKEIGNATSLFELYDYDRTHNIKRSTYHAMENANLGKFLEGNQGAMAMAIGSTSGKDLSTAVLFLIDKENNTKYAVIAKCNSKKFSKLSEFQTSAHLNFGNEQNPPPAFDKYAEVERIHGLKEKGILSAEEFEAEKTKLLR